MVPSSTITTTWASHPGTGSEHDFLMPHKKNEKKHDESAATLALVVLWGGLHRRGPRLNSHLEAALSVAHPGANFIGWTAASSAVHTSRVEGKEFSENLKGKSGYV